LHLQYDVLHFSASIQDRLFIKHSAMADVFSRRPLIKKARGADLAPYRVRLVYLVLPQRRWDIISLRYRTGQRQPG